jgi:hypothetical protein
MLLCGVLKCGERWIPKFCETIGGCPKILLAGWSVDVAIDHEREKWRMKERTNELTSLISSLNIGSEYTYLRICAIGRRENCWCRVQHVWVGGFGMG